MYEGVWQDEQGREGDPDVLRRPDDYAPFPYRRDHLTFMKMDGRRLAFRDGMFDIAYSLSSIEHFGGMAGAVATLREMARVLKPGGILALATEYVLDGPSHPGNVSATRDRAISSISQASSSCNRSTNRSIAATATRPWTFTRIPYQTPHMVVRFDDTVFTTVMVFLRRV